MSALRRALIAMVSFAALLLSGPVRDASASDAERLAEGLGREFRRPVVALFPLLDQRHYDLAAGDGPSTRRLPPPEAWTHFVAELVAADNLTVHRPSQTADLLVNNREYQLRLLLAREKANQGYSHYREVRLERAVKELHGAVQVFVEIEHYAVDPREIARAEMTRGLALQESGHPGQAVLAYRQALLFDPTLRPRAGYDRPETIAVFDQARELLTRDRAPPAPFDHARRTGKTLLPKGTIVVRGRTYRDQVEVTIQSAGISTLERIELGRDSEAEGSRLAGRVRACIPFGTLPPRKRHRRRVYVDAGFTYFVFADAPGDGPFSNVGAAANLSWHFARHIALDGRVSLTNSNRDRSEDLRADVATLRASLSPGFVAGSGRWRGFLNVGFEFASPGAVVTTASPGCKFFSRADGVPRDVCDFERVERVERTMMIGGVVLAGGSLRLVDRIHLALRGHFTNYFFESQHNDLAYPVGFDVGLGYWF